MSSVSWGEENEQGNVPFGEPIKRAFEHAEQREAELERPLTTTYQDRINADAKRLSRVDVAIVLGGNDEDRLPYVRDLHKQLTTLRATPLRIICSGKSAAFTQRERSEANDMALALHAYGIPLENLALEDESRDTIANIIHSARLLTPSERTVGIITSGYHRARAEWFAHRVITKRRRIEGFGTPTTLNGIHDLVREIKRRTPEVVVGTTVTIDTMNAKRGDYHAWDAYLREDHPFHAPYHGNTPSGLYTRLCRLAVKDFDATVERIIAENKQ